MKFFDIKTDYSKFLFKIITYNQQLHKLINHGKSRVRRFC